MLMTPSVELNNGISLPMVGLGTSKLPLERMDSIVATAFSCGYRKFDTAWLYKNEVALGKAFRTNNLKREDLFITSKLHDKDLKPVSFFEKIHLSKRTVRKSFEDTCKRLQTDYLDLYLLHWPFENYIELWDEMVKLYNQGRVRAIGVCSFLQPHLQNLQRSSSVIPAVNQFEINPYNTQKDLIAFCQQLGIHVEAYATFGTTKKNDVASQEMLQHIVLQSIAEKYGKTVSQVILRWSVQQGISVIPRSSSIQHQKENIDIFDFTLSDEDMDAINQLNQNRYSRGNPHKTLK